MSFPRLLLCALLALAASPLHAAVSLLGQAGSLFDSNTTTTVPDGSIAILVADTDKQTNAGLVDPFGTRLSVGSSLGGSSGDLIVGLYTVHTYVVNDLGSTVTGIDFGGTTFTYGNGFNAGDDLWLLWFPTESLAGALVGSGVSFGAYRSDEIDVNSGSDIAFVAPPDGSISSLYAFSASTTFGLASDADLSATSTTAASQPPTDLKLSVASVNPSAGLNATVGTLTTVDADDTDFTYSLVAGAGSTDNGLFNVSGSTLRANDASALAIGSYSIRVQTQDAAGNTFAKTFTLSASYIGTYFGTLGSGGHWALHVRGDNSAVYLALLPARQSVLIAHLTINADGSFTVTDSEITGDATSVAFTPSTAHPSAPSASLYTLTGAIGPNGAVTGSLSDLGDTLTGSLDPAGPAQASSGFYMASALGTDTGSTYTIIGASGQAMVVTTSDASVDGATGTVGSDGTLSATTAHGAQLSLAIDSAGQSLTASLTPAGASTPISFAGLPDTVTPEARVVNLSVRSTAGTGSETLIVGFVVAGSGTENLLLRGVGPGLVPYGVGNAVADPGMHLFDASGASIDANDDWDGSPTMAQTFAQVGAFSLPSSSKDASLLTPLPAGLYSFHISAHDPGTAVALAELYDVADSVGTANLTNISARTQVGSNENILIAGFVVTGNAPKTLLLRGLGPTLAGYGVSGVLADPQLELFRDSTAIAYNDNWGGTPALKNAFATVGASPLASDSSSDAALLVTLQPGVYSAQVSGVGHTTGVGLVEIFLLP